jgi:hypothetical protein
MTPTPSHPGGHPPPPRSRLRRLPRAPYRRERDRVLAQHPELHGLLPLLMKPRNGLRWEDEERHDLHWRLKRLAHVSPYLMMLLLPGSIVFLPLVARWLDRRRGGRRQPRA